VFGVQRSGPRSILTALVLPALLLLVAACGSDDDTNDTNDTAATTATNVAPDTTDTTVTGPGGDPMSSDRSVFEEGDIDIGLTPFIDDAVIDLAERLDIDAGEIEPVSGVLVVWPDSALGCPEPDMLYAHVIVDGSVIELRVGDRYYRYHTGGAAELFLCEQPWSDDVATGDPGGLPKPDPLDEAGD
jgi:hypothetical protein